MSNMTEDTILFDWHVSKKQLIEIDDRVKWLESPTVGTGIFLEDCEMYLHLLRKAVGKNLVATNFTRIQCLEHILQEKKRLPHTWRNTFDSLNLEEGFTGFLKAGVFETITCNELKISPCGSSLSDNIFTKFKLYVKNCFCEHKDLLCDGHLLLYYLCCTESIKRCRNRPWDLYELSKDSVFFLNSISELCQKTKKKPDYEKYRKLILGERCDELMKHFYEKYKSLVLLTESEIDEKCVELRKHDYEKYKSLMFLSKSEIDEKCYELKMHDNEKCIDLKFLAEEETYEECEEHEKNQSLILVSEEEIGKKCDKLMRFYNEVYKSLILLKKSKIFKECDELIGIILQIEETLDFLNLKKGKWPKKQCECKNNYLVQLISTTLKLQDTWSDSGLGLKNLALAENFEPDVASNMLTKYKLDIHKIVNDGMFTNSLHKLKCVEINDLKPKFNDSVFSIYLFDLVEECVGPLNLNIQKIVLDLPKFLQVSSGRIPAIETWSKKSDECKKGEFMPYVSTLSTLQDEYLNSDLHEEKPVLIEKKNFNASLKKMTENEQSIYWFGKDGMCTKDSDDQERLTIKKIQPDFNYSLFNSYWIGKILIPKTVEGKIRELISPVSPILTLPCKKGEFMPYISTLSILQNKYLNSDLHTVKSALTEEESLNKSLKKSTENEPSICNIGKDGTCTKISDNQERLTIKAIQPDFSYSLFKSYWTGEIVFPKTIKRKSRELVSPISQILTLKAKCLKFILDYEKSASLNKNPNIGLNYFARNELSIQKFVEDSSRIINSDFNGEQLIHESNNSDFTNHLLQQDEILPLKHEVLLVKNPDVPLSLLSEEDKIIRPSSKVSSTSKLSLKSNCPEIKESYDSKMDFLPDFQYACECSSCPFESLCEYCETYVRQSLFGLFSVKEQPMETSFHCIACATCCNRDGKLYFECGHYSCFQCFSSKFENCCKPLDTTVCIKCENEFSKFVPNYLYGIEECVQTRVLHDWYEVWTLKQNDTEMQMPSSSFRKCNYISVC